MIMRSSILVLAALAVPVSAQQDQDSIKPGTVASFYQAYFLDKSGPKNKTSMAKAATLYAAFIAKNPSHKLAGQAAANLVVIHYANGAVKKAEALVTANNKIIAAAEASNPQSANVMSMFRGRGRGGRGGGEQEDNPNQDTIDKLMDLREDADEAVQARLGAAITRLGGARDLMMSRFRGMGRGGRGGGFGGRGRSRGLTKPNIKNMSQDDAKAAVVKLITAAERQIDTMASQGKADEADELEAKLDKIEDLVDDGKLEEAQKLIDSIKTGSSNRGGRSRGGRGGDRGGRGGDRGGRGGRGGERGGRRRGGRDPEEGGEKEGEKKEGEKKEGEGRRRRRRG